MAGSITGGAYNAFCFCWRLQVQCTYPGLGDPLTFCVDTYCSYRDMRSDVWTAVKRARAETSDFSVAHSLARYAHVMAMVPIERSTAPDRPHHELYNTCLDLERLGTRSRHGRAEAPP